MQHVESASDLSPLVKKILIISYVFPPYPGIGGRRWAKMAKYLSKSGYEVHVVCARHRKDTCSVWLDDVIKNSSIHVHLVNVFYPGILEKVPNTIYEKLKYRIWKSVLSLKFNGYIYDRTLFSVEEFLQRADEVIQKHNIEKVVVTGAPFRLVHAICTKRNRWKNIHLTADFRDPWTWEDSGVFQSLNRKRFLFERKMEKAVINAADIISVPTLPMKKHLEVAYPLASDKFVILPHAWDEDEIQNQGRKTGTSCRLVLFGTLYPGIENQIRVLAKVLTEFHSMITLDIYSDSDSYKEVFREESASHLVSYFNLLPSKQFYKLMPNYTAAVIINNDSDRDHVSTKFIELAASGTPVIYIARSGKASKYVTDSNAGWHTEGKELRHILETISNEDFKPPVPLINLENLSFRKVSEQFLHNVYNIPVHEEVISQ